MDVHHYEVSGPRWEEFLMEDADFMGMMELLAHDNNDDDTRMEQSLCKEHKVCSKRASPPVFPLLTMPSNSQQTVVYEYDKTWKMKRRPTGLKYRKRKKSLHRTKTKGKDLKANKKVKGGLTARVTQGN